MGRGVQKALGASPSNNGTEVGAQEWEKRGPSPDSLSASAPRLPKQADSLRMIQGPPQTPAPHPERNKHPAAAGEVGRLQEAMQTLPVGPVPLVSRRCSQAGQRLQVPMGRDEDCKGDGERQKQGEHRASEVPQGAWGCTHPNPTTPQGQACFPVPSPQGDCVHSALAAPDPHRDPEKAEFCTLYTGKNTEPQDGSWARRQQCTLMSVPRCPPQGRRDPPPNTLNTQAQASFQHPPSPNPNSQLGQEHSRGGGWGTPGGQGKG